MEFPVPSLSPAPACRTRKSSFIPASSCCCRRSDPDSSYSTACNVQVIGSNSLKIAECKVNNLNGQFFPQLNFRHTLVFIKLPTGSVFDLKVSIFQKYKDVDMRTKVYHAETATDYFTSIGSNDLKISCSYYFFSWFPEDYAGSKTYILPYETNNELIMILRGAVGSTYFFICHLSQLRIIITDSLHVLQRLSASLTASAFWASIPFRTRLIGWFTGRHSNPF